MADERTMQAIGRLERALARIEAAAARAEAAAPANEGELRELREVHQSLRAKVEGAISQIDRLLAGSERS